jgi:hypothetical protein
VWSKPAGQKHKERRRGQQKNKNMEEPTQALSRQMPNLHVIEVFFDFLLVFPPFCS